MYRLIFVALTLLLVFSCSKQTPMEETVPAFTANGLNSNGKKADPHYRITFPKDHLPHPDFDIEWWYLTANLTGNDGKQYGLQWTLFRFSDGARFSPWIQGHVFMGHASLHNKDKHWFNEKFAGAGLGNAGVKASPLTYFIDTWQLSSLGADSLFPAALNTTIVTSNNNENSNAQVSLRLSADRPFVLQGEQGYSIKTANASHASHYYSQPFISVSGTLTIDGDLVNVTGNGWYDHEWSSQLTSEDTLGWDWFSVHLDDASKLMLFRMRVGEQPYITGTFIQPDGKPTTLMPEQIALQVNQYSTSNGRNFPSNWTIKIRDIDINIKVNAVKKDAFNPGIFSYYEGPISVTGSHTGVGFLELTGY